MTALAGRVALVTGGGRGIGRAIALRFAEHGAAVVVTARTAAEIEGVVAEIVAAGGRGLAVQGDALDPDSAEAAVRRADEEFGRLDVLVNNVGGSPGAHSIFHPDRKRSFEKTLALNLTSAWWTTSAAVPVMLRTGYGRIITIGSGAARFAASNPGYTAAKHGLIGLTRQLARDLGPRGITVNCISPGATRTSLLDFEAIARRQGSTPEAAEAESAAESAQNRILEPDELSGMALLLASADGAGITGQELCVDGGYRI